ncbi:MAG: phosphoribosylpyrophosphate synthetase [Algicola sp.]|nr:phosphoribosylpyrophosphate synthetase [Algicola sp.]
MCSYDKVSEAKAELQKRGYSYDYAINPENKCLVCHKTGMNLSPIDFIIDEFHRFDGDSDPDEEMIVYAISSEKYKLKGVIVIALGVYSDSEDFAIVELLRRRIKD